MKKEDAGRMTKAKAANLPKKLSDLIELAVDDVKAVARNKKYILDLDHWHIPMFGVGWAPKVVHCAVCFAGSVIANTLKKSIHESIGPDDLSKTDQRAMFALNGVRQGLVVLALYDLEVSERKIEKYKEKYVSTEEFYYGGKALQCKEKRKQFYKDMARVVKQLREVGL